jgi:hypothetical protein
LASNTQRFGQRLDTELLAIGIDQQYFSGSYPVVGSVLVLVRRWGYAASLLDVRALSTRKGGR